jgi:hypothetical protein
MESFHHRFFHIYLSNLNNGRIFSMILKLFHHAIEPTNTLRVLRDWKILISAGTDRDGM